MPFFIPHSVSAIGEDVTDGRIDPDSPDISPSIDPSDLPDLDADADDPVSDPDSPDDDGDSDPDSDTAAQNTCQDEAGSLGWIICPTTGVIAKFIDGIYNIIHDLLVVKPLSIDPSSSIYRIWQYVRTITNIISAILLVIVIYSQITGLGLNNYGIKRVLPRLIITVVLINLSFHICALAVDVSNILGAGLRGLFSHITDELFASGLSFSSTDISISSILAGILSGGTIAGVALAATGGIGALFWTLIPVLIGGVISIGAGFITIALRQALIALLVMISPLAFVAYLLPNTERWFAQWKNLFYRMLIFFPMFSFLFGASQLVGIALIASATNGFGIVLGVAVQIIPLFFAVSLMKMSGTILSSINTGIQRLANPIQRTSSRWAFEHGERARNNYLNQSEAPGAHLRKYLDYRRELRLQDTANAVEIRHGRAHQRAYIRAASITGHDDEGNTTWSEKPNHYTRNAKTAAYYRTLSGNATAAYQNTLSAYGTHFGGSTPIDSRLNLEHARAFEESMAQNYLAQNQAQADQDALLKSYLSANTNKYRNRYEYNRLIKNAAGDLGHNGESSIIGQVIATSAMIEERRKREAEIISTKFGHDKPSFRAMVFDMASISDNGRETNEDGIEIEDNQYHLLTDPQTNQPYVRRKWPHYIGVHKVTKQEISKDQYDALPATTTRLADGSVLVEGKDAYDKVRYCDIPDDDGNPTGTVFMDDAGYMKVLLAKDIAIGDPINNRYDTAIGLPYKGFGSTGELRRYHSTITGNLNTTKYKEHDAGVTAMLLAQSDRGFISTVGQHNLARIQSISVAGKAGSFLRNDGVLINEYTDFVRAISDDDALARLFPTEDMWYYRNVNGVELDGWRLVTDENGQPHWQVINHNDPSITRSDRMNLIRHKILPKFAAKLVGMANRNITPGIVEDMKPDGLEALEKLLDTLSNIAISDLDMEKLFEDHMNADDEDLNIFGSNDHSILRRKIIETQHMIREIKNNLHPPDGGDDNPPSGGGNHGGGPSGPSSPSGGNSGNGGGGNPPSSPHPHTPSGGSHASAASSSTASTSNPYRRPSINQLNQRAERRAELQRRYEERNSFTTIISTIEGYFQYASNYETVAGQLLDYFNEVEVLRPYIDDCARIIDEYRYTTASSLDESIRQVTHYYDTQEEQLAALHDEILNLISMIDTY